MEVTVRRIAESSIHQVTTAKQACITVVETTYKQIVDQIWAKHREIVSKIEEFEGGGRRMAGLEEGIEAGWRVTVAEPWDIITKTILESVVCDCRLEVGWGGGEGRGIEGNNREMADCVRETEGEILMETPELAPSPVLAYIDTLLTQGMNDLILERFKPAKKSTSQAVSLLQSHFPTEEITAEAYLQLGKIVDLGFHSPTKAESLYMKAFEVCNCYWPESDTMVKTCAALGSLYADNYQFEKSDTYLTQGRLLGERLHPCSESLTRIYNSYGYSLSLRDQWKLALKWYRKSLNFTEISTPWLLSLVQFNIAICLDNLTRTTEALSAYEKISKSRPISPIQLRCFINIGLIRCRENKRNEALLAFEEGAEIGKTDLPGGKCLAELLEKQAIVTDASEYEKKISLLVEAGEIYMENDRKSKEIVENALILAAGYIDWAENGHFELDNPIARLKSAIILAEKRYFSLVSEACSRLGECYWLENRFSEGDKALGASLRRQGKEGIEAFATTVEKVRMMYGGKLVEQEG